MAPIYEHVIFPVPIPAAPGTMPTLPTNEDNALVIVETSEHDDVDNLAEEEELLKQPVPESEIAEEREALQEAGKLPPGDGEITPPPETADDAYYKEGINETGQMFGDATRIVENDGGNAEDDDDAKLEQELINHLETLDALPTLDTESFIKPAA
ncbi:uncharacterized protein BXIN_2469 [Babesia sp. Xinjiang]|uniref:uncharacterized protein n=1 Tax=Babesia sp. Xinjiang TaxID=462227 RepID=UPI000A22177F|nr:uncharacterized protein BXIN_2469 [Babesia sp. Xinjiang]ORM41490.1 hypothetical protein BXIN_2469 [Babesia sp. Xinjiang]